MPTTTVTALSDAAVIDDTARTLSVPRSTPADSFVLHAPLELLARAGLLPMVEPTAREEARDRLRWLAESYTAWGAGVEPARHPASFVDAEAAITALDASLRRGDLDDADEAASWLSVRLEPRLLTAALADPVLPRLAAAAHGSIFLYHLPRFTARSTDAASMLRCLARELARYPDWNLSWFDDLRSPASMPSHPAEVLADRLRRPPSPGEPGSNFIFPVMSLTETSGLAHDVLHDLVRGITVDDARRVLLRTAAMSMLQDDGDEAPYGWSHCLTMPQATLGIAHACSQPWQAVAVASTYVLGFRSMLGRVTLDSSWTPEPHRGADPLDGLDGSPHEAAAAAWHADLSQRPAVVSRLAARASVHHDAHLVKFTLACIDAAHADPEATPLFLAAAAYLGAWWRAAEAAA